MIVVSNTTPIISLASIGKIDILKHFFDKVYIPQAVYDEIKSKKAYGYKEIDDEFFQIETIKDKFAQNILLNDLDLGEAQTIVLAKEMSADIVLIDETIGYNLAKSQQLNVKRTLSFLIASKYLTPLPSNLHFLTLFSYRGREEISPPSEPYERFSRIRLSS